MRFSLQSLLLATPCFGLAIVEYFPYLRYRDYVRSQIAKGDWVCGTFERTQLASILLVAAGIAALCGYRRTAVFVCVTTIMGLGLGVLR